MPSFSDCHGCSLCLLPCPMWRQHRDVAFSPQGFAKAMQAGATALDLREYLSSCIMCGACDVMCPENIDLSGMVAKAWQQAELPSLQQQLESDAFNLSCNPAVQAQISQDDFYIIDAAPFHAHHAERVRHYDQLRQTTGCSINLDLNRMAIPTGADSVSAQMGKFDVEAQINWLVQGRKFQRVIVESEADQTTLAEIIDKPVIHVSQLLE
ncbi:MAG: (Fe-S)-binding protein [Mariprofundus sp.]|nr:(Fe-S)-binding protein [Mariprofundus sp.]